MTSEQPTFIAKQNRPVKGFFRRKILNWLRLTDQPLIRLYRGYGSTTKLTINGHVLRRSARSRRRYRDNKLLNMLAVVRLFLVKPYPNTLVRLTCVGHTVDVKADADGYFRHDLELPEPVTPGWYPVRAELLSQTLAEQRVLAEGSGQVLVPHDTDFACISDIDDTFLISHSATIAKRLQVLLTENAHSRKPFAGVVAHYQLLAEANSGPGRTNPFFYVSSSEWNLYSYILEFSAKNGLPDGVYLLSQLKQFNQLLQTGKTKHFTKFDRIVRILETYPDRQFVLLGDDSQQDPTIYASIVEHFPRQIRCVYIRRIRPAKAEATQALVDQMQAAGVACCYFTHSVEAHEHSVAIGLVAS